MKRGKQCRNSDYSELILEFKNNLNFPYCFIPKYFCSTDGFFACAMN